MILFTGKPNNMNWFLSAFVDESNAIDAKGGILINGRKTEVKICCFICDTPARAALKGKIFICYSFIMCI